MMRLQVKEVIFDEERGRLTMILPTGQRVETSADPRPTAAAIVRGNLMQEQPNGRA